MRKPSGINDLAHASRCYLNWDGRSHWSHGKAQFEYQYTRSQEIVACTWVLGPKSGNKGHTQCDQEKVTWKNLFPPEIYFFFIYYLLHGQTMATARSGGGGIKIQWLQFIGHGVLCAASSKKAAAITLVDSPVGLPGVFFFLLLSRTCIIYHERPGAVWGRTAFWYPWAGFLLDSSCYIREREIKDRDGGQFFLLLGRKQQQLGAKEQNIVLHSRRI